MNSKLYTNAQNFYFWFSLFVFIGCLAFDRSFVGLVVGGFRFGELVVGISFILSIVFIFTNRNLLNKLNLNDFVYNLNIFKIIIGTFLISCIYFNTSFTNTYTFKTSSYIWMISIFFGLILVSEKFLKSTKLFKTLSIGLLFMPITHYLFSTGYYPNFIMDIFIKYSDKFNFTKASDVMITLLIANILFMMISKNKKYSLLYFSFSVPLLLPLLLEMSRGSFLAALFFYIFIFLTNSQYFKTNKKFLVIFLISSSIFFIGSTYRIGGVNFDFSNDTNIVADTSISGNLNKIAKKNETRKAFLSFYIEDGRVVSHDNTTNWRLDIWQDVVEDLNTKEQILSGYGYNEIIPVMTDPSAPGRLGRDGLNEHVHSYAFNILARGGIIQLFLFIAFHSMLIFTWLKKNKDFKILGFIIPVFINSLTDMNMEGVQFPYMYYFFLGYLFIFYDKNKISF